MQQLSGSIKSKYYSFSSADFREREREPGTVLTGLPEGGTCQLGKTQGVSSLTDKAEKVFFCRNDGKLIPGGRLVAHPTEEATQLAPCCGVPY